MIETLRLHGRGGDIRWGYRPVADLGGWLIVRAVLEAARRDPSVKLAADPRGWQLQAVLLLHDAFALRQSNLFFTAPRLGDKAGGFWNFPLLAPPEIAGGQLRAWLHAPER